MRLHLRSLPLLIAASLALASPAYAAAVAPGQATPVQREQAQSRFLRGKDRYGKGKYEEALAEFQASLEIVASPNTRLYVARCHEKLGRLVAAYVEFGRTEVEAKELSRDDPRYTRAGESAHEEREALASKLGFAEITITNAEPSTTLKVAGDEIRRAGWTEPVPMMPGSTEIVVETPGRPPITRTVEVNAGEKKAVAIDAAEGAAVASAEPEPAVVVETPKSDKEKLRIAAYVAGGVAVVGLGMFTIFGLSSNSTYSDLEQACGTGPCPPGHEDDISTGRTQQTLANVGLGVALVGAAAGATLFVLSMPRSDKGTNATTTTARVTAGPSFVGLKGTF